MSSEQNAVLVVNGVGPMKVEITYSVRIPCFAFCLICDNYHFGDCDYIETTGRTVNETKLLENKE